MLMPSISAGLTGIVLAAILLAADWYIWDCHRSSQRLASKPAHYHGRLGSWRSASRAARPRDRGDPWICFPAGTLNILPQAREPPPVETISIPNRYPPKPPPTTLMTK
jgi:hypothetical protein